MASVPSVTGHELRHSLCVGFQGRAKFAIAPFPECCGDGTGAWAGDPGLLCVGELWEAQLPMELQDPLKLRFPPGCSSLVAPAWGLLGGNDRLCFGTTQLHRGCLHGPCWELLGRDPFAPLPFTITLAHVAGYGPALPSVLSLPFRIPSSEGSCSSTWLGHAGRCSPQVTAKPFVSESRGHSERSLSPATASYWGPGWDLGADVG